MHLIFLLIFTGCISNTVHTMQNRVLEQAKESLLATSKEVAVSTKTHQSTLSRLKYPIIATFFGISCQICGVTATYFIDDPDIKKKVGLASLHAGWVPFIYSAYTLIRDYRSIYQKTEPVIRQVVEEGYSEETAEEILESQEQV